MSSLRTSQNWEELKVAFLPIKPIYAERLMNGTKQFEFRRRPISSDTTHIVVYASSPYKRILGMVEVKSIEHGSIRSVWERTKSAAGISRVDFLNYFAGSEVAYAIAIDPSKTVSFEKPVCPPGT